jgi:hypothetical protein
MNEAPAAGLILSPSVQRVLGLLASEQKVSSWRLVTELLSEHLEYGPTGRSQAGSLRRR